MDILKKIQAKPENERKIIFWFLAIVMSFSLFLGWLALVRQRLANLNLGRLRQELKLPELNLDQLKQWEERWQKEEATP